MSENINRVHNYSFSIKLNAGSQEIFPLICETKDHSLYTTGKAELVYSISGLAEDSCIFKTTGVNDKSDSLWVISAFDPEKEIQLVKYNSSTISLIKINLSDNPDSSCKVEFYYSLTVIKDNGGSTKKLEKEIEKEINHFRSYFTNRFEEV